MLRKLAYRNLTTALLLGVAFILAGCGNLPVPGNATSTSPPPTNTPVASATPLPSPTPTPLPPLLVLLAPPESDPGLASELQGAFSELAKEAGLRWQVRQTISPTDVASEIDYLIALPPGGNVKELIASAPETRFLAVGIPELEPASNLISIGSDQVSPDHVGFLAGYIAAVITPEWRVGVISVEDTGRGIAARDGFLNGARYFCGLCRSGVPPFYEYPLFIGLPAGAGEEEWRAVADFLIDRFVKTVYVAPGAGGDDLLNYLFENGVNIIGGMKPPENLLDRWVVSIRKPDLDNSYLEYWPNLLAGEMNIHLPLPLVLADVNPELLSPGKQLFVEETLKDLQNGFISTGASTETP